MWGMCLRLSGDIKILYQRWSVCEVRRQACEWAINPQKVGPELHPREDIKIRVC